jgi:DNA-directed RNA polymerase subunit beta'
MEKLLPKNLLSIRIKIASPETIRSWSHGEVTNSETINYRTQKPEPGGLFCERIFGPIKDYECSCGKFRGRRYKGVKCDKCGVEVTEKRVRRERMGHIELAVPVAHIWFYKATPSPIGILLDLGVKDLERVIYYDAYIVTKVSEDLMKGGESADAKLRVGQVLSISEYQEYKKLYGNQFEAEMGAPGIKKILANMNLEDLRNELRVKIKKEQSPIKRAKFLKKYKIVQALLNSKTRPEWMILEVIPVIPPDLRPIVFLENGQIATTEINQLYRRVIMRNNRLKQLMEQGAPQIIINNEKRNLQEAVEALLDNSKRRKPVLSPKGGRKLKSISDVLRGKKGVLRRNLLGKRVDYSGRSVIVVAPELKMNQVALPKEMALELFRPMVEHKLNESGLASSIREAEAKLRQRDPAIWEMLEKIVKDHPVLLNRAPTLHRPSIQAFEPVLWENKAIGLHPLVCPAYNADFDGDTMAVYVPISYEAQLESYGILLSIYNILSPAHGGPLAAPTRDIVLGLNYLTKILPGDKGEGKLFSSPEEALIAYENGYVGLRAKIRVKLGNEIIETSVGRIIFNDALPEELRFINEEMRKGQLSNLVAVAHRKFGPARTAELLDALKELGFKYSTVAGITFGMDDMVVPEKKKEIIQKAREEVEKVIRAYEKKTISEKERQLLVQSIWTRATEEVKKEMLKVMEKDKDGFNPIYMMLKSGARGNEDQVKQLAGMRGLMAKLGKVKTQINQLLEVPIISNNKEGFKVLEYFISTHGSRKGLVDTAMKTSLSGYYTRRLVNVAHHIVVTEEDCGTLTGRKVSALTDEKNQPLITLAERIVGRVALEDIYHPITGEIIVEEGQEIDEEAAKKIEESGITEVWVRSVLTCKAKKGVCAKCYGRNHATGHLVEVGEAVGVMAAQSLGEPSTQLTLRTFHTGGTGERTVGASYHEAPFDGIVEFVNVKVVVNSKSGMINVGKRARIIIRTPDGKLERKFEVPYGSRIYVEDGQKIQKGQVFCEWDPYRYLILATKKGKVVYVDLVPGKTLVTGAEDERIVKFDRRSTMYPRMHIVDPETGELLEEILLSNGAILSADINEGDIVEPGDVLARLPIKDVLALGTRDITVGFQAIEYWLELFTESILDIYAYGGSRFKHAILSEISGRVSIVKGDKGKYIIKVTSDSGEVKEYPIFGQYLTVAEGDWVEAGEQLTGGRINPKDILRIKGIDKAQEFLLDNILRSYAASDVKIKDVHVEIFVRQMGRKVLIKDAGDTKNLIEGDLVDISVVEEENREVREKGGKPATYEFQLLGIKKAALASESFLSAASFIETTKVLTEAAIAGKEDKLEGLIENVIIGNLIPAGTGTRKYRNLVVEEEELLQEEEEEPSEREEE